MNRTQFHLDFGAGVMYWIEIYSIFILSICMFSSHVQHNEKKDLYIQYATYIIVHYINCCHCDMTFDMFNRNR